MPTPEQEAAAEEKARLENEKLKLENAQAEFDLEKAKADARRAAAKDYAPDLTKVEYGSTTTAEGSTAYQALLAGKALVAAAKAVGEALPADKLPPKDKILLVTTDLELAARDAHYRSVVDQLTRLTELVERQRGEEPSDTTRDLVAGLAVSAAVVAAQVLPGLLTALSPRQTLTTSPVADVDDEAGMLAVAGVLAAGHTVVVDKARLLENGTAHRAWTDLHAACGELQAAVDAAGDDAAKTAWAKTSKELLATCTEALTALVAIPKDGTVSALATATLQEALHSDAIDAVLVVKGGTASNTQLLDDRRFKPDRITIVATASIGYLLIDRATAHVRASGLATGSTQVNGELGKQLSGL